MRIKISIIVPVFEQWEYVPEFLDCLRRQTYPMQDVEVLLVDNGSRDIKVPDDLPHNVKVHYSDTRGAYAARNHGVRQSCGDWLVFTDADCLPHESWLGELICAFRSAELGNSLIAGRVNCISENGEPSLYEIYDIVRGIPQEHYVSRGYAATANLAAPRAIITGIGGFNDSLYSGGDADLCRRATQQGATVVYVESAVVSHRTRSSWSEIATKARRVKGGQLTAKSMAYKLWVYIRTILSPCITIIRFVRNRQFPVRYRLLAGFVYFRVWGVELAELIRVSFGGEPERR